MDEISNKTLATLLVVAIVISLAGTFFAMRGVSQITNIVTGAQSLSETGTARVEIERLIQITLINNSVDFGKGYRNSSVVNMDTECNLTSNMTATDVNGTNCWINTEGPFNPNPFVLRNTGTVYVNVTINSTSPTVFLNGTSHGGTRRYAYTTSDSSNGTHPWAENGCNGTIANANTWTAFDDTHQLICTNMSPTDTEDEISIDINISITSGLTGLKTTDVVFTGAESAQGG